MLFIIGIPLTNLFPRVRPLSRLSPCYEATERTPEISGDEAVISTWEHRRGPERNSVHRTLKDFRFYCASR